MKKGPGVAAGPFEKVSEASLYSRLPMNWRRKVNMLMKSR